MNAGVEVGDRIELVSMPDDPHPVEPGTRGTVTSIDERTMLASSSKWDKDKSFPIATNVATAEIRFVIDVDWDSGSSLKVLLPKDTIRKVE